MLIRLDIPLASTLRQFESEYGTKSAEEKDNSQNTEEQLHRSTPHRNVDIFVSILVGEYFTSNGWS